jgi:uncharacterized glyoxalase superfamily protein PhnB
MSSLPHDWPQISTSVFYDDASAAIDFLCRAFGFSVRLRIDGDAGEVIHSELTYGRGGLVMVGSTRARSEPGAIRAVSPRAIDGRNTQALFTYVEDVEAHQRRALAAGAVLAQPLETHDYGDDYWTDRTYGVRDPEGHFWWFAERVRSARVG